MSICLGQVLSILIALTGVFTTYLTARKVNIPTTQSLFNYVFLTGNLGLLWWRRRGGGGDGRRDDDVNGDGDGDGDGNEDGGAGAGGTGADADGHRAGSGSAPGSGAGSGDGSGDLLPSPPSTSSPPPSLCGQHRVAWWKYLLCALVDVEGNYLVVKAYQYTTITSATLLDCFTIPCCMALAILFLGRWYSLLHVGAVGVCLGGLAILVWSDFTAPQDPAAPPGGGGGGNGTGTDPSRQTMNPPLGDLLSILGAVLYACSNVSQEVLVKVDRVEYLGMLGLFGTIISGVQVGLLERDELAKVPWDWDVFGLLFGYAVVLFAMYTLTSRFLVFDDAVLFNLSLLTSDVWAVLGTVWCVCVCVCVCVCGS